MAALLRTMMTTYSPRANGSPCARNISLTRRRKVLRNTAWPIRFVVMMPNREAAWAPSFSGAVLRIRKRPASELPSLRTMPNSEARFMVWLRLSCILQQDVACSRVSVCCLLFTLRHTQPAVN